MISDRSRLESILWISDFHHFHYLLTVSCILWYNIFKHDTARNIEDSIVHEHIEIGNKTPNGPVTYVLDESGNIIIGKRNNPINPDKRSPHPMLIGGKNPQVQCAGMITFKAGKITSIDNQREHFRPNIKSMDKVYSALHKLYETNPELFSQSFKWR